jgi:hypothetical protein
VTEPEFDPERLLTALSGDVAVLRRQLAELATAVEAVAARQQAGLGDDLDERLDALAAQIREVAELQEQGSGKGPAWDWSSMTASKAADAWRDLVAWIDGVLLPRNPTLLSGMGTEWAPCWYLHLDAVDELSALYGTWKCAFTGSGASAARVAEWRDRWLPGTRSRLKNILGPCTKSGGQHRTIEPRSDKMTDPNALYAHIEADLRHRSPE